MSAAQHDSDSSNERHGTLPSTIRLHRVFKAPAERVYRAFLDPGAVAKFLPPHGFTCTVHAQDATVGGTFRMSFTNFANGQSHSFGGTYLELVPGQRIVHTDQFENPDLPGGMVTTLTFASVSCGTELNVVQEGIPDTIPVEACHLGWQETLALLALLVEAGIPG